MVVRKYGSAPHPRPTPRVPTGAPGGNPAGHQPQRTSTYSGPHDIGRNDRTPGSSTSTGGYGGGFGRGGNTGGIMAGVNAANEFLGDAPADPFAGMDLYDILNFGNNPTNNGGGSRGSGGGGGSTAALAATNAAYQQMLAALKQKQSADMAGFDTRQGSINDLSTQGGTRLAGILGTLNTGAVNTRQAVQDSYNRSDANQAALQAQFAAQEAARAQGAGQTLGMFGGSPGMVNREYGASDMLNAQRGLMAGVQGANDSMWAGRGAVYDGLFADAQTQNSTMQQQLLQQLAAARQQASAAAAAEQAKLQFEGSQAGVKF